MKIIMGAKYFWRFFCGINTKNKIVVKIHDKYQKGHIFGFYKIEKKIPQKFQTDDGNLEFAEGIFNTKDIIRVASSETLKYGKCYIDKNTQKHVLLSHCCTTFNGLSLK